MLLDTPGCLLDTAGCSCVLLGVCWMLLGAAGCCWVLLGAAGCSCLLRVPGCLLGASWLSPGSILGDSIDALMPLASDLSSVASRFLYKYTLKILFGVSRWGRLIQIVHTLLSRAAHHTEAHCNSKKKAGQQSNIRSIMYMYINISITPAEAG